MRRLDGITVTWWLNNRNFYASIHPVGIEQVLLLPCPDPRPHGCWVKEAPRLEMPGGWAHHLGWPVTACYRSKKAGPFAPRWDSCEVQFMSLGSLWSQAETSSMSSAAPAQPASLLSPPGSSPLYTTCANVPIRNPASREAPTKTGIDNQIINDHKLEIYKIKSCLLSATFNLTGVGCHTLNVWVLPPNMCWSPNPLMWWC